MNNVYKFEKIFNHQYLNGYYISIHPHKHWSSQYNLWGLTFGKMVNLKGKKKILFSDKNMKPKSSNFKTLAPKVHL